MDYIQTITLIIVSAAIYDILKHMLKNVLKFKIRVEKKITN